MITLKVVGRYGFIHSDKKEAGRYDVKPCTQTRVYSVDHVHFDAMDNETVVTGYVNGSPEHIFTIPVFEENKSDSFDHYAPKETETRWFAAYAENDKGKTTHSVRTLSSE